MTTIQSVDSTRVVDQVLNAPSLLAYVAGNSFIDYAAFAKARPDLEKRGWIVSTTLTCNARGRCYDIEPGGGQNKNIGIFMHNADRTHGLPWLYTFASNAEAMIQAAARFGYHQGKDYYAYIAHPNSKFGEHICSPRLCGFPAADGTQYLFANSYDRGILNSYMLPKVAKPPAPKHAKGVFSFEGHYDHDKRSVHVQPLPGKVESWGDIDEWIRLGVDLHVGPHHPGQWRGKVLGRLPR